MDKQIHKRALYGTHRDVPFNMFATTLVNPEEHQLNGVKRGQVCMPFLNNISVCCCWG